MTRFFLVIVAVFFLLSCTKREVQLAESFVDDITEVTDVSPIYIFFNEDTGEADFNRNNMIGTTNWLVNIDKRLSMKQVYPHLQFLYEKRRGDGMHKNEQARNYFSCSNPDIQNLTFIDFTQTSYHYGSLPEFMEKTEHDSNEIPVYVNFEEDGEVLISKGSLDYRAKRESWGDSLITVTKADDLINLVYLNIHEKTDFQDYIHIRSVIDTLDHDRIQISSHEFIFK